MAKSKSVLQRLTDVVIGTDRNTSRGRSITSYNIQPDNTLYSFASKAERDNKLKELKQQKLLSYQWAKCNYETSMQQLQGATQVKVMYRDADLMDGWPEIGSGLDIISEEATVINKKGKMINITSKSKRIVSVLEDLFINRLDIHVMGPMVIRSLAKYGNEFMFLNIDKDNGVLGWRELPVHEMKRVEGGMQNMYSGGYAFGANFTNMKPDEVKFVWEGHNEQIPYKNWQVAHFRLIKDSLFLPYGVSYLNKARRHWRMLSMMEDAMFLYRLERSIERRIFKVNVGLIDDEDVPGFLQEFMNNVKRAPIIDPLTGQIDLRKNFLDVSADYVIPVRNGQDPTSIDVLQGANNQTSMDDINYIENKVFAALRMPKTFLNFNEAQGKGQNLSLLDIRFCRTINSIQQAFLLELTKIAIIHLYLLGFTDELTNFSLTMNNPSNQIEMLELDNDAKRLANASTALAEQGGGIPLMSWHQVQKEIMGRTDSEISDMLNEMRLEVAIAMELQRTSEIIKKTGLFKQVDRIYGEPGATYSQVPQGQGNEMGGPSGGGGAPSFGGGGFGDELGDLGEPGADDMGDIGGNEGSNGLDDMSEGGGDMLMENRNMKIRGSRNTVNRLEGLITEYKNLLESKNETNKPISIIDKTFILNEEINNAIKNLDNFKEPENIL